MPSTSIIFPRRNVQDSLSRPQSSAHLRSQMLIKLEEMQTLAGFSPFIPLLFTAVLSLSHVCSFLPFLTLTLAHTAPGSLGFLRAGFLKCSFPFSVCRKISCFFFYELEISKICPQTAVPFSFFQKETPFWCVCVCARTRTYI